MKKYRIREIKSKKGRSRFVPERLIFNFMWFPFFTFAVPFSDIVLFDTLKEADDFLDRKNQTLKHHQSLNVARPGKPVFHAYKEKW